MIYPYGVLEVSEKASDSEIRAAYLKQIRKHTPENHPEKFQETVQAYNLIKDKTSRAKLSVFGFLPNCKDVKLSEFIQVKDSRTRIGIDEWINLIKGDINE